jgi:hypothetical protein
MRSLDCEAKTKAATANGASGIPPAEANAMKDARRLARTLLVAGVFALLAMIYVPGPAPRPGWAAHYRFIFSQHETGIALFQLLVNVAFAATVGALAANIPKRFFTSFRRCFFVNARCDSLFYCDCHSWLGVAASRAIQAASHTRSRTS